MRPFVHLHLHSQYSLLCGAVRLEGLFKRLPALQMPAVALTDRDNMFGAVDFQKQAAGAKVKPLIALESSWVPRLKDLKRDSRPRHLVLIATSAEGYAHLRELSSDAYLKSPFPSERPCLDLESLRGRTRGLIGLSGGVRGAVEVALHEQGEEAAEEVALALRDVFEEGSFFLEVQPLGTARQSRVNAFFLALSRRRGLPLVATNECLYVTREEARAYHALACIARGVTLSEYQDEYTGCDEHWLKDGDTVAAQLGPDFEDAVARTLAIAERCDFKIPLGKVFLPTFRLPEGFDAESYLAHRSREGLGERFREFARVGKAVDEGAYLARLDMEIGVINRMKFPGYFLIVQDFINWAKDHGIPVGPGRGSGAGSLVAYALRITDLDPIPYGLLFERFLNPERVSMPDFDIDFCMNRRLEVIEYVTRKYGEANVGQIATFGALKAKGVLKDVGRVLGMGYGDTDHLSKLVPDRLDISLDEALKEEPRLAKLYESDARIRELIDIARTLEGLHRNTGMHAAGVVIGDEPLWRYCPVFRGVNGELVTQFAKDEVEQAGLVKFDFLGLKTLTVIQDAVGMINQNHPDREPLDVYVLPLTDPGVYELISSGETDSVFQLESSGFQELLKKLRPDVFEDIVAAVALYRPGPLNSGMLDTFIHRKHGKEPITFPHELIRGILTETYGVIVYQEQVMQIAQVLANFSLGGADLLRRAMGKKKPEEMAKQRVIFAAGAAENQVDEKVASEIFDLMELFAEYGFNKSHSAAYALLTYHTAYLKVHHPAEFMASVLSNDRDTAEKVAKGVRNALKMGLRVLPPCVNRSLEVFYGKGREVLFGLGGVKGVGSSAVEAILEARAAGPFESLLDFCERVNLSRVNKATIEKLIQVGAFDFVGAPRRRLCAALDALIGRAQQKQKDDAAGQDSLFGLFGAAEAGGAASGAGGRARELDEWREVGEWNQRQLLEHEKLSLGFFVSGHPLDRFAALVAKIPHTPVERLPACDRFQLVTLIGTIAAFRAMSSKQGPGRVGFATLEDRTGAVEVILGDEQLNAYEKVITSGEPVALVGEVKVPFDDEGEHRVTLGRKGFDVRAEAYAQTLAERQEAMTHAVELDLPPSATAQWLRRLRDLCASKERAGRCPLLLRLRQPSGAQVLVSSSLTVHPTEDLAHELRQVGEGVEVRFVDKGALAALQREVRAG
ncbi:MAG: DNA polymerase III subunit alpha, partial [Deltaproteobacteria bacterium]|nr:DNA polymerase III subunit alpha [Deltaproteobacteria bacterium]